MKSLTGILRTRPAPRSPGKGPPSKTHLSSEHLPAALAAAWCYFGSSPLPPMFLHVSLALVTSPLHHHITTTLAANHNGERKRKELSLILFLVMGSWSTLCWSLGIAVRIQLHSHSPPLQATRSSEAPQ